jgi:diacylglycerol kinase family enzyme
MKVAVIINKHSGTIKNSNTLTESYLKEIFDNHSLEADIYLIEGRTIKEKVLECLKSQYEVIVAAGGDGTVSSVASHLVNTDVPLGVLPLGTLNHFAKDLNIPLDLSDAIKLISEKKTTKVDVGEVNEIYFINNSSVGMYPKMVKKREEIMERIGGRKWIAMFSAFISILNRFPLITVHINADYDTIFTKTPFVFIGNNEYEMNLFQMGSRNSLSSGKLSIYTPTYSKRLSLIKFFFSMLINKLEQQKDFVVTQTDSIVLETKKKIIEVASDGEVRLLSSPLKYKIHPLALTVIAGEKS